MTASHKITTIDPEGDLTLTIGTTPFLVSSKALQLASPFFGKLLADGRTSHTVAGNPEAGALILNIWHYNVDDVAEDLDVTLFYEVAKFVEEWKCLKSLGLWSRRWTKAWSLENWDENKPRDWEKWAKIGGVFGKKDDIVQVVMKDMLKSAWDKMDEQEVVAFKALAVEYGFVELGDELETRRSTLTTQFQEKFQEFVKLLYTESPSKLCKHAEQACGSMIVVSLLQKFYAAGLLDKSEDVKIPFCKVIEIVSVDGVDVVPAHVPACLDAIEARLRSLIGGTRKKDVEIRGPKPTPAPQVEVVKVAKSEIPVSSPMVIVSSPKVESEKTASPVLPKAPHTTPIEGPSASIATQASDTPPVITPAKETAPKVKPVEKPQSVAEIPTPQQTPQSTPQPAPKTNGFTSMHAPKTPFETPKKKQVANEFNMSTDYVRRRTLARKIWPNLDPGELQDRIMSWDSAAEAAGKAIEQEEALRKELEKTEVPKVQLPPAPAPLKENKPSVVLPHKVPKPAALPPHLMHSKPAAAPVPAVKPTFSNPAQPQQNLAVEKAESVASVSPNPLAPVQWTLVERRGLMQLLQADESKKDLLKSLRKRFKTVPTDHIVNVLYRAKWNVEEATAKLVVMESMIPNKD